jgi:regulator of RNase E activity RraA
MPGTYVFADSSGAVAIPGDQIEEVLAEARKVEAEDAAAREQIARELSPDQRLSLRSRARAGEGSAAGLRPPPRGLP